MTLKKPALQWFDLELDFEDQDKTAIEIYMKKTQKLWHNLFTKYANKGIYRVKTLQDYGVFDGNKRANETISLPEISKLLKDHKVFPKLLQKDDV